MKTFLFYGLSLLILLSALFVVTVRNLFRGAVGLITLLLGVAGLYLLMDAQFLSAVQIMVYVGGIVVLIVYVVLLISDVSQKAPPSRQTWRLVLAGVLAAGFFALITAALFSFDFAPVPEVKARSASVAEIGAALLSPGAGGYALPFEIISLVLIAAIVGAITIAYDQSKENENGQSK